tara:strand:- start:17861 stop:18856 length:996 start_codon:yes stop_codon:yes gene_type:complete
MNINHRAIKIINETIESLDLNLNSYVVLTEVGSNNYLYTPIIPLLAGAKKVYAWTNDSSYGNSNQIISNCKQLARDLGLLNRIEFSANNKIIQHIKEADIITNSGFIRPINKNLLKHVKPNIAIPLMYEKWEIRDEDLDIKACTNFNIKVAGTWENHPKIKVFDYVKDLTLKMVLDAGYEISGNKFIVWSNDNFGKKAEEVLRKNNAKEIILTTDYDDLLSCFKDVDAVLLFDYKEKRDYFGLNGIFNLNDLIQINKNFGIIHLYGKVDISFLKEKNINVYPNINGKAQSMTFTLAHVGLLPVLRLLTAGFKVAQESLQNNLSNLSQPINF